MHLPVDFVLFIKKKYIKYTQQQIIIMMIYQMNLTRNQTNSHDIEIVDMSRAY